MQNKKCTNSKCRKVFKIRMEPPYTISCPYCGKKYPRIQSYYRMVDNYWSDCRRFELALTFNDVKDCGRFMKRDFELNRKKYPKKPCKAPHVKDKQIVRDIIEERNIYGNYSF